MFFLLIKVRLLSARNIALDSLRRQRPFTVGLTVLGVLLFAAVYGAFFVFLHFAERLGVFHEVVYQVFYFLFLFLLAGATPFVAATLLQSSDYGLLFNAPLPPRAIVAAKLLDATVTNSVQFSVLGLPAIAACAVTLKLSFFGWLMLPPLIALFILLPALLTALGLLLLLAALGIRRLRAAIALLNALMALIICATIVLEAAYLPKPGAFGSAMLPAQVNSPSAHAAPSAWFARALLALSGEASVSPARFALEALSATGVIAVLYGVCIWLGARLLSAASVAEEEELKIGTGTRNVRAVRWFFSPPVAALILKDFKYMRRDSILLSQLAMPMILFFVPFLMALQDVSSRLRDELLPASSIMIGIILFMQTSILSLSSIGLEGRSFWILLNAPNGSYRVLWAKWVMSSSLTGGVAFVLTLFSGLLFKASLLWFVLQSALGVCCAGALCGLGVGIGAALPRFIYENPAHRVSGWALILGFFATVGYMVVTGLLAFTAWYFAINWQVRDYARFVWSFAGLTFLSVTFAAIAIPLFIGAKRLERYQWEA